MRNKITEGGAESGDGLNLKDLVKLCILNQFEADKDSVLVPIMETFEKDIYGEVPCNEFID